MSKSSQQIKGKENEEFASLDGYYTQIGSSGNSAQIGPSGDYAQIGSSGDYAQIGSSGDYAVVIAIGHKSKISAKKDSWIVLAEYDNENNPICVKTAKIDGKKLKEDVFYKLEGGKFVECIN